MKINFAPVNVQPADRAVRIGAGIALLAIVLFAQGGWRWIGLVGMVPLLTGLLGWCPLYALLARD